MTYKAQKAGRENGKEGEGEAQRAGEWSSCSNQIKGTRQGR